MTAQREASEDTGEGQVVSEFQRLLDILGFAGDDAIFLSNKAMTTPTDGGATAGWNDTQSRADMAAKDAQALHDLGRDLWFTPAVFPKTKARRLAAHAIGLRALHLDLDFAESKLGSEQNCRTLIDNLSGLGMPVAVVRTGGGLHPYWRLEGATDRTRTAIVLKRFSLWARSVAGSMGLGKVDTTSDLARVLRVPGTLNRKPEYPEPRPVVLEVYEDGDTLHIDDVEQFLDDLGILDLTADDVSTEMAEIEHRFAPEDWDGCGYFQKFLEGSLQEKPVSRHNWLLSKFVRLHVAASKGCVSEESFKRAANELHARFVAMCADPSFQKGERPPGAEEVRSLWEWGGLKAGGKSEAGRDKEWACLGHVHVSDEALWVLSGDGAAADAGEAGAGATTEGEALAAETAARRRMLQELERLRAIRDAERQLRYEDLAPQRALRRKRTAGEFAQVPQPPSVIDGTLAAEVNLLGGPSAAGKSLLARDWALHVASGVPWRGKAVQEARNVLWIASEGVNDFQDRWASQPLWKAAEDRIWVLDVPVDLTSDEDVVWLLKEYADERPGLVVFDIIYGMGLPDDNGTKDVIPLLNNLKEISRVWGAATLAIGHSGHGSERRFRGSSSWRQLAYTEWHAADGIVSCEKSKIANAAAQGGPYTVEYPNLNWLSTGQALGRTANQQMIIAADVAARPKESISSRAGRLHKDLGVSKERARKVISQFLVDNPPGGTP